MKKSVLVMICLLALALRFLYFPENTYFGFDQARDAYAVKEILSGHLKMLGPPTANGVIHHGVLYYYIFAPFYFFSSGDPLFVSSFLRVFNTLGVFMIFLITLVLFNKRTAMIAAFLFAISFEQTQFALFLNHPSLAVISVLFFYLGLAIWIFRKLKWGFYLTVFSLGLSIQFEFVESQLIAVFILFLLFFKKSFPKISLKEIALGFLAFFIPLLTYIISEIKNGFPVIKQSGELLSNTSQQYSLMEHISSILPLMSRHIQDNLMIGSIVSIILGILSIILTAYFFSKDIEKRQLIFLTIWFLGGFLVYLFIKNDAYFYNTGTSVALLIFTAFLLSKLFDFNKFMAVTFLLLIFISNIYLITKNNPLGPNTKINPQIGLLLKDEQKVVDFIYQEANEEKFAVNALTMPYNINTTWSYLFEWYGKNKYGYIPVWGGDAAEGFPGNIKVERARSKLPNKRFLIIEPLEGIPSYLVDGFLVNEKSFATTIQKKQIGTLQIWVQQPK